MKHIFTLILLSIIVITNIGLLKPVEASPAEATDTSIKKIAMLISGHGNIDADLSYDLEELVQSYLIFYRNQVQVDIVTPKGGSVPVKNNKDDLSYVIDFKNHTAGLDKLANTLSVQQASKNKYDALFIVGGDGAVFDLPFDEATKHWITYFAQNNMPIAAVCHGPAALIDIKLEDGSYYVSGKLVNSFTYVEDHAFKKENINKYPVIVQTELEKRGARFVSNKPMLPFVTKDGTLITAQNPTSVAKAAEALLIELGIKPSPRNEFKDEAAMELIAKARTMGLSLIDIAMTQNPEQYDIMYLALYGFYAYNLAQSEQDKEIELGLMEKIGEYFKHPQYSQHMINTLYREGYEQKAKKHFDETKGMFPELTLPNLTKD